jgi:hypothetical protein
MEFDHFNFLNNVQEMAKEYATMLNSSQKPPLDASKSENSAVSASAPAYGGDLNKNNQKNTPRPRCNEARRMSKTTSDDLYIPLENDGDSDPQNDLSSLESREDFTENLEFGGRLPFNGDFVDNTLNEPQNYYNNFYYASPELILQNYVNNGRQNRFFGRIPNENDGDKAREINASARQNDGKNGGLSNGTPSNNAKNPAQFNPNDGSTRQNDRGDGSAFSNGNPSNSLKKPAQFNPNGGSRRQNDRGNGNLFNNDGFVRRRGFPHINIYGEEYPDYAEFAAPPINNSQLLSRYTNRLKNICGALSDQIGILTYMQRLTPVPEVLSKISVLLAQKGQLLADLDHIVRNVTPETYVFDIPNVTRGSFSNLYQILLSSQNTIDQNFETLFYNGLEEQYPINLSDAVRLNNESAKILRSLV